MSSKHQNINFTVQKENVGSLVFTENQHLVEFSTIMKVLFQRTKRGLLSTVLHRNFSICCDFKAFQFEIDHFMTILV